jgi:hypothetical protein
MSQLIHNIGRRHFLAGTAALGMTAFLQACGGARSNYTPSTVIEWNIVLLQAISEIKPGPSMVSRAIGMVHTAIYDAWSAYTPRAIGTQLGSTLRRPIGEHTQENKEIAIAYAAYRVLIDLYPSRANLFNAQMQKLNLDAANNSSDTTSPIGVGNVAAQSLLSYRHSDGSNQLNNYADTSAYIPSNAIYDPINTPLVDTATDPSKWQPLRFANGAAPAYITPHWGQVTPFALTSGAQYRPIAPPVYGTPAYRSEAQTVIDALANITEKQKVIAEYWADGPSSVLPPGHWMLFAQVVSARDRHSLDADVKLFFLMGNAVMDAGIATWEAKRFYNTARPITAIRSLFAGTSVASFAGKDLGINTVDGKFWMPYQSPNFITPPFPEYTSGHSAFSSAAAEILKRFTGSDNFMHSQDFANGWSTFETNVPQNPVNLYWATFTEAADEAGLSRIYGGIHFTSGDLESRTLGRNVGAAVWNKGALLIGD